MKRLLIAITAISLIACGGNTNTDKKEAKKEEVKQECTYTLNADATTFNWLAYKHTDKVGVPGVIDSVNISGTVPGKQISDLLANAEVQLFVPGIDSKDATRDKKIMDIFFGAMTNSQTISGKVIAVDGNNTEGNGQVQISLNGVDKALPFSYKLDGARLTIKFVVDFTDFNGDEAIAALNKACEERHTGKDGESVLWPDVKITITSVLERDCE